METKMLKVIIVLALLFGGGVWLRSKIPLGPKASAIFHSSGMWWFWAGVGVSFLLWWLL